MKFEDYHIRSEIKRGIQEQNYRRPTDIQFKCIGPILQRQDVLAIAQTGTGKTAAFVIPILERFHKIKLREHALGCIVLAPTRELALQITESFKEIGKYTSYSFLTLHGGTDGSHQQQLLKKGVNVIVGTPGRVNDLVRNEHIDASRLPILVLDEADRMLDFGFYDDITYLLRFVPEKRQTLFFSATINDRIKKLAYSLVNNPIRIQISPKNTVAQNVDHAVTFIDMDDKRFFLEELIKNQSSQKILVFVRTKVRAERVQKAMDRVNIETLCLHGDHDQKERVSTLDAFKTGKQKVLITTDLCSRGIDIPFVDYVVNYDLPDSAETYVHRVGRTGRAKNKGKAVSFCSDSERAMLKEIEENLSKPIEKMKLAKGYYKEVLSSTEEKKADWQGLMEDELNFKPKKKKKK